MKLRNQVLSNVIAAGLVGGAALVAPACSSEDPLVHVDGGGRPDGEEPDALEDDVVGDDAGNDAGDGTTAPAATKLKGGSVTIQGITTDDHVVYSVANPAADGGATASLEVLSLGGGQPTVLSTAFDETNDYALTDGKVVAFWTNVNTQTFVGALHLWTASDGIKNAATASISGFLYASEDGGSRIAYSTSATATTTSISIGNPALNPASVPVITGVGAGCQPVVGFAGTRLFAATCGAAAGATVRTVGPAPTNTVTSILVNAAPFWASDATGTVVFVRTAAGAASVHTVPANVATPIDTAVASGFMLPDGKTVVYRTSASALKRAATAAPVNPTVLVAANVRGVTARSDDFARVMTYANAPDTANPDVVRLDLSLASTATAGAPTPLVATSTGAPVGFSGNSAYALYFSDIPANDPLGILRGRGVAAGAAEKEIAQNVLVARPVPGATSTKVAFLVARQGAGSSVALDLDVADLAGAATPTLVAADVDGYSLTTSKVVFTQPSGGLFVAPLP